MNEQNHSQEMSEIMTRGLKYTKNHKGTGHSWEDEAQDRIN